jgi:hypothetical protein
MTDSEKIVFRERPKPCAGDLRISWRLALLLIILSASRSKKASMAKLHVLNDAARSERSRLKLLDMMNERRPMLDWRLRVEPALSRAVDFLVGEGFARWDASGGKMYVQLLPEGEVAERALSKRDDYEALDQENLRYLAKHASEAFVSALIGFGRYGS